MSGSKRSCPFGCVEPRGSPGRAKALKEDTASIYAATLHKLKVGARSCAVQQHGGWGKDISDPSVAMERLTIHAMPATPPPSDGARPCYVCTSRSSDSICFHCSRGSCEQCCSRCQGCQELFCSICCTSDYTERLERSFCFDCSAGTPALNRLYHQSTPAFRTTCNTRVRSMDLS